MPPPQAPLTPPPHTPLQPLPHPPPSISLLLQVFSLQRLSEPTRLQRIMTNGVRTFSLLMVPIAASVPAVRTTRGLEGSRANGTSGTSSAKGANSSVLSLPVHGPVLVLLQPGWVGPPAAPSLPLRPPTAAPAGPALPEPLQRPAGSSGAPVYQETWEVTKTQFWTGEPVLDTDRDPFLG